jgi:hypothetical protein
MQMTIKQLNDSMATRWRFLDERTDACSVVTRRMELLYLNSAAKALAPGEWFGRRCWQVFPVADSSCASRCPVVKAVSTSGEIAYCEETFFPAGQPPLVLSVAVIPFPGTAEHETSTLLFMRPKPVDVPDDSTRAQMMEEARRLQAFCVESVAQE